MALISNLRRHALRSTAALAAVALLASCGSSSDDRNVGSVVSFGDSLSDVGSFRWGNVEAAGGGRYTTNSGLVWAEHVANYFDAPITRNRTGGAGNPSPQFFGGLGYAQGGARVSQLPGVGGNPSPTAGVAVESAALPIRSQITAHLAAYSGKVPSSQLVLIWGGANDIFYQLGVFGASVGAGVAPATAQQAAIAAITTAGTELSGEIKRLVAAGATKIVVPDVPDIAPTPFGQSSTPEVRQLMSGLVQVFNQALAAGLAGVPGVQRIDNTFFTDALARPAAYGFANITLPACNFPTPQQPSSLYCTLKTLNAPGAEDSFLYADGVHPTSGAHRQFANFVISRINTAIPR